ICINQSATLNASGAFTYQWSPATGLNTTTGASVVATPLVTTTYSVTGSNNSCSAIDYVVVNIQTSISVTVSADQNICPGSAATLYVTGAVSYNWSPGTGL